MQEKGKVLPDSTFFSDKNELKYANKHKIVKIQVWYDSADAPCIMQCHYKT